MSTQLDEKKTKLVALIGKSGSGKDTILKALLENYPFLNRVISYTTRPPRAGEEEGKDYFFIDNEKFADMILDGSMIEAACFNDWGYGTANSSLDKDKVNIGIFSPEAVDSLCLHKNWLELYVFYIEAEDRIRLIRQLSREAEPDIDEIFRRYKTDRSDFYDLDFHHNTVINNTNDDLENCIEIIGINCSRILSKLLQEQTT